MGRRPASGSGDRGFDGLETPQGAKLNVSVSQFREDQQAAGYRNDVSGRTWLRNGNATQKPFFDRGNAWRHPGGKLRED